MEVQPIEEGCFIKLSTREIGKKWLKFLTLFAFETQKGFVVFMK